MSNRPKDYLDEQKWADDMSKDTVLTHAVSYVAGFISAIIMYQLLYVYFLDYLVEHLTP